MASYNKNDPMVELYVHETNGLIEQLETKILESEREGTILSAINEIFRVMHTIKGNSMMMQFTGIANCSHALEDLFDFLRSNDNQEIDNNVVTDFVLETVDFIKLETEKIVLGDELEENINLQTRLKSYLSSLKNIDDVKKEVAATSVIKANSVPVEKKEISSDQQFYLSKVVYEPDCQMVSVRAYAAVSQLSDEVNNIVHYPLDFDDMNAGDVIHRDGLFLSFTSDKEYDEVKVLFERFPFLKDLDFHQVNKQLFDNFQANLKKNKAMEITDFMQQEKESKEKKKATAEKTQSSSGQKFISVKVAKLDELMNLVSELVVSESMVTRNPELENLKLDNFRKAAKQMKKIMNDLQDVVMEIRMVPLSLTFQKMNRLARDMSSKTGKKMELVLIGQDTEVDKNIIEHISDPIMHLVRNAIDHGLESNEERLEKGKNPIGKVELEAKQSGGEILIMVRDDGKGLDPNYILNKAEKKGLLKKPKDDYTNEEAFELIFQAGFSTREQITGFSGRGVGMDVVAKGIEHIGGQIQISSELNKGTEFTIRIPLTLAIVDCILVKVGSLQYAIPITSIKQIFNIKQKDIISDSENNEMVMLMDKCIKVVRIHDIHGVDNAVTELDEGIFILVEKNDKSVGIFIDRLLGEYQLVVKNFSKYLNYVEGVSGCALLGDGSICLILDPLGLCN